jgi:hypothetical protein
MPTATRGKMASHVMTARTWMDGEGTATGTDAGAAAVVTAAGAAGLFTGISN